MGKIQIANLNPLLAECTSISTHTIIHLCALSKWLYESSLENNFFWQTLPNSSSKKEPTMKNYHMTLKRSFTLWKREPVPYN